MKLGTQVGLGPGHAVIDGDPVPPRKEAQQPPYSKFTVHAKPASVESAVHVYCSQTAVWIKKKLGMDVGLSLCQIVLNGDPAPLPKRAQLPPTKTIQSCLLWMDQDAA